jgi:hypothetical protein
MGCIVCGATPTVKSHIIPRALFHDMKRPGQQFIASRPDEPGYVIPQSGAWDDSLLCARHERELGRPDNYGVRFCRRFAALCKVDPMKAVVENRTPSLLVDFAASCVWRMAASRTGHKPELWLGPYAKRLQNSLFGNAHYEPKLLVSRHAFQIERGRTLNMGLLPFRYKEEGIRFWRFSVCGLIFDLKLDGRRAPPAMETLFVNNVREIALFEDFPQNAMRTPGVGQSLSRITAEMRPRAGP